MPAGAANARLAAFGIAVSALYTAAIGNFFAIALFLRTGASEKGLVAVPQLSNDRGLELLNSDTAIDSTAWLKRVDVLAG
ncbi:hypothetical protein DFJ73DRAFT_794824 [Zopfochytrium polystomum]|nr:hypothetical protein DFJ73DRAFT_794824 [Zopfochytrium polystomum]